MKKRKLIIAILAFIIIEIASFITIEFLHKKETTNYLAEKTTEAKIKTRAVRDAYTILIETLFKQIIEKPDVLELYSKALNADSITQNEIRDSLYNLLLPTYEQLKVANIRQFIFIFPNNEVFLRFHRPEKFGDDLTNVRYSVKMANQTKQIYTGFEEGRSYNGFRNIFPIYYEGKHIGVIEISFSFAINILFKQDNDAFNLMIDKDIVNLKLNESRKNRYIQSLLSDEYLHEKEFLHYKNDTANILKQIDKNIKPIIADRLANNENFTIYHHINKADYLITFISIKNVEGNPVAYIVSYHKDKDIIARLSKRTIVTYLISSLLLAILIFVVLQFSLKRDKLREKEIEEKKILETFKEGIYIVSPEYNITYANSALQNKIGKNAVGQKCYKAVHNLNKKCSWCIYENLKQEKNTIDYEFETEDNKTLVSNNILLADNSKLTILTDITEKKKNEQALKESEEKLNIFMNNLPGCAFIKDNKGKYVFLNKHFETIYGFNIPKLLGKGDEEIWGKEKALEYFEYDNKVRKNKTAILIEEKLQIKDKEYNWLTSKFNLPNGYIAGISFDISKQKEAEQALKDSEEKLNIFMNNLPGCAFIKDNKGKYVFLNKHFETIYGFDIPKLIGKGDEEIWGKEKALKFLDCDNDVRNNKKPILAEDKFQIKGKEYNWLTSKFNLPNGYIAGISFDISKQKEAENALKKSEDRLSKTLMAANDGMWDWNLISNEVYFDPRYYEMAGYTIDEFPHKLEEFQKRIHPDDLENVTIQIQQHLEGKIARFNVEFRFKKKSGDWLWIMGRGLIVERDKNNKPLRFIGTHTDISKRKAIENTLQKRAQELQERNEDLDAFSHSVAHDLKNPLGNIMGFADLLSEDYDSIPEKEAKLFINAIIKSGKKAQEITNSLLLLANVRKAKIKTTKINMEGIVKETLERLSPIILKNNANITFSKTWPTAIAYSPWVEEVLINYLSNAIKYGGTPPVIEIGYDIVETKNKSKNKARFWVKDNGSGISEKNQALIFKKFERLDQVNTEGYGLGLSIVKRIIEKLGGEVSLESKMGKGSKFCFTLPLAEEK